MSLLICLPIAAFVFFFAASSSKGHEWRAAFMQAAAYWGIAVVGVTEALSALDSIGTRGLACAWLLVDIVALIQLFRVRTLKAGGNAGRPAGVGRLWNALSKPDDTGASFLSAVIVILMLVGVVALLYPPNTQDSMVYHMPRIVHWLHNHNVGFYATHELRQLKMPPWAEYAMLQFHGLSRGDRFDNLIQWFAMLGSVIGVSLVAQLLGAPPRGQVLAALICATVPQGILEASGAKNDYVLGFWLVALAYYMLAFKEDRSRATAVGIGASLGLACLTKTTAFLLAPPLMLGIVLLWRWDRWRQVVRCAALAFILALALNAGHFLRNTRLFGTPFGPGAEAPPKGFKYSNDRFGIGVVLSNMVRNVALHLGTPSPFINSDIERASEWVVAASGGDVNDPATTWDYTKFQIPAMWRHEALAGNPLHLMLIFLTLALLVWRRRSLELRPPMAMALGITAAFVVLCAVLKWQPWNTRLHLPLFLLWSAVTATVLAHTWPRFATALLGIVLVFVASPTALENQIRPLSGDFNVFNQPRSVLYFADRRDLLQSYTAAAQYVAAQHCNDIGLVTTFEQFEYPLLALLGDQNGARNIRDIGVTNVSRVYAGPNEPAPCVLICPNCQGGLPGWTPRFATKKLFEDVAVLSRQSETSREADVCSFRFIGWYSKETDGAAWWRWSAGVGEVHIAVSHPMEASLDGELSSIQQPNTVNIVVNGANLTQIVNDFNAPTPIKSLPLHLRAGENVVTFVSRNQGIKIPTDPRVLAMCVRNLHTRAVSGGTCTLQP